MTAMTLPRPFVAALCAASFLCSAAPIAPASSASASRVEQNVVAPAAVLRTGDVAGGALPGSQVMRIVVALKLRDREALDEVINTRQALPASEIASRYLPTKLQAKQVADYLAQAGYRNVVIAPNRMLVSADGTAANAERAFLTSFSRVLTTDGRTAFANNTNARVPAQLVNSVLSVIGLQTVYQAQSHAVRPLPRVRATAAAFVGHNPNEFPAIYAATGLPTGAGIAVGIMTVGSTLQVVTDLNAFTDANGLARVTTETVESNPNSPGSGDADLGEWDLDSQTIVGSAGGQVGKIVFYNASGWDWPSLALSFNKAVSDNQAKIINASLGGCETGAPAAAMDQSFALGVAQGQTFSISNGDFGGDGCRFGYGTTPQWPAASQYVVAIGGTTLNTSSTDWNGEIVWNDTRRTYWGTGGSPSRFEPQPTWQNGLAIGNTRNAADIAFVGDPLTGARITVNGGLQQWGGTSLSAPIFSGLWARVIAARGTGIGFAAPLLYALPASDFHDITMGNNYSISINTGFLAQPGYDTVTGRGSLIMANAILHLGVANPLVANFNVTSMGLTAKFTDTSSGGTVVSRAWIFGDGGTSTLANPSHRYLRAGTYSVSESITGQGFTATKTMMVTVSR